MISYRNSLVFEVVSFLLVVFFLLIQFCATGQSISLAWDYSSNTLAIANSNGWPYTFRIYTTNVSTAPIPWMLLTNLPASSLTPISFDGTNYTYAETNPIAPGQAFFYATISNIWGESGPSNTSSVPPLTTPIHTKILKN